MKNIVHARDESAIENGSFYLERQGKRSSTFSHYMNGDRLGYVQAVPAGLRTWPWRDAKKMIPAAIR